VDTSLSLSDGAGDEALPGRVLYQGAEKMNGFNLDVVQLSLSSPMDESDWAAGYAVDLLLGPDASYYSTSIGGDGAADQDDVAVRQAYVNTRVPVGNGLDLKLGVFDAIIGYEGFSNRDNPNYSRNMAYNLQPFNHTGVLAGYQVNDLVGVQFGVANTGLSAIADRSDSTGAVSYMGSVSIEAPDSFGPLAGATLYVGAMKFGGVEGEEQENIYVGSTIPTPIEGLSLGAAYDGISGAADADVFAGYVSYQATDKLSLHGRIEYLDGDHGVLITSRSFNNMRFDENGGALTNDGFVYDDEGIQKFDEAGKPIYDDVQTASLTADGNGGFIAANSWTNNEDDEMLSLTATVQYDLWENVLTRAEVRYDQQVGDGEALYDDGGDDVLTFTLNAVYSF
jgi:hypothetical protein